MRKKSLVLRALAFSLAIATPTVSMPFTTLAASETVKLQAAITQTQPAAINGMVYATLNLPYADFYYGELLNLAASTDSTPELSKEDPVSAAGYRDAGQYDAVSSATTQKSTGFATTYYETVDTGVNILGLKDVQIAIPETLYNNIAKAKEENKTCNNKLFDFFDAMTFSDTAFTEYKVLNANGTFSKMISGTTIDEDAVATITTNSRWGNYQINIQNIEVTSTDLLGVLLTTSDGKIYGMEHLENLWLRPAEMSFAVEDFTETHGNKVDYARHADIQGKTITKITYLLKDKDDLIINTNLKVKRLVSDTATVTASNISIGSDTLSSAVSFNNLPSGANYQLSKVSYNNEILDSSSYSYNNNTLTLNKDSKIGTYTLTFTNDEYEDITTTLTINSLLKSEDISLTDNQLSINGTAATLSEYINAITSIKINDTTRTGKTIGSTVFDNNGNINFNASISSRGQSQALFANGLAEDYTLTIEAAGYPSIEASVGKSGVTFVYAGLSWAEYWASEGVYAAGDTTTSTTLDSKGENDTGAYDVVSRATTNHGLHRGSFQCEAVIYDTEGKTYQVSSWNSPTEAVLTDGSTITFNKGSITTADGKTSTMDYYEVQGTKYVPVAVRNADYESFCANYSVAANGSTLTGGYAEGTLQAYSATAAITGNTNGLKIATKDTDGNFNFSARSTGTDSGLSDTALKTVSNVEATVKDASGAYGEFLRVDLTGDGYGDLGSKMYAVKWTYYGADSEYKTALTSYGTKFAADNWMHKSMGIQLGLTDSLRCQLPENTDGTGYWQLTVYAMGYEDYTINFEATSANIVSPVPEVIVTTDLESAITQAEALKESDYTSTTWATLQTELSEAKEELSAKHSQSAVDEAKEHLLNAISALIKAENKAVTTFKSTIPKVSAKSSAYNSVTVSWNAVDNASGYYVYRKSGSSWQRIATVKSSSTLSFKDSGLNTGTAYTYTVKAYGTIDNTSVSSSYNKTGIKATPTLESTSLSKAASSAYNKVTVTWKKVSGATGYYVYRKSGSSWQRIATVKNTSTSYTQSGLSTGTKYTYTVKAYRTVNGKPISGGYNTKGVSATPTLGSTSLSKAASSAYNKVTVTWKKVSGATGYYVYRKSGSSWKKVATVKNTSTSYTQSGLSTGTKYTYTVKAYRTVNGKPISGGYNTKGVSATPTLSTVKLGKVSASKTALKVSWSKVSGATGYYVYRKSGKSFTKIATVKNVSSYTDTTAKAKTKYTYTVKAYRTVNGKAVTGGYNTKGISGKR